MDVPEPPITARPSISRAFPVSSWERYEEVEFLGAGGMGNVFRARDPRLGRAVALKLIRDKSPELVQRFLREARAQARIEHAHICKVYEVGEVAGHPYIAMALIQGRSLKEMKRAMTLEQKVVVVKQIAEALHEAHRAGLIHRDIKPANIMIEQGGDGGSHSFLMDFGIAREVDRPGLTATGIVEGTPSYMAPEQARGESHRLDRRTDVYSLGATLYELLTGRPPFVGETSVDILLSLTHDDPTPPRKVDAGLPVDLETIVMKCLEKEPSRRYESAKALADDLRRYIDGEPITARPATLAYVLAKKARKHKLVLAVAAVALASVLAVGVYGVRVTLAAREQARVAQRLGQDVKEMEHFMRFAYALPLHDAGAEKAVIRARMEKLAAQVGEVGGTAEGPLHYALGRGHLVLHEHAQALERLSQAWAAGYRTPEVELAMGLTLGELYKRALDEAKRIPDRSLEEAWRKEADEKYLAPALQRLTASSRAEVESPLYVEALVAFYSKEHEAALAKAREAFVAAPWLYEAKKLEGDVLHALGDAKVKGGDPAGARRDFDLAIEAYRRASNIARSDAAVHEAHADGWLSVLRIARSRAEDPGPALERAVAELDNALTADPTSKTVHVKKGLAYFLLAEHEMMMGNNPSATLERTLGEAHLAMEATPDDAVIHDMIGNVYGVMANHELHAGRDPRGLLEQSVRRYGDALRRNPRLATAWHSLATAHIRMVQYEASHGLDPRPHMNEALAAYERAIELDPTNPLTYAHVCNLHWRRGAYEVDHGVDPTASLDGGAAPCSAGLKLNPSHHLANASAAFLAIVRARHAMMTGGDPGAPLAQAKETAARALKTSPTSIRLHYTLVTAYWWEALYAVESGKSPLEVLAVAHVAVGAFLKLAPSEASAHLLKGRLEGLAARAAMAQREDPSAHFEAARAALDEAIRLIPSDAEIYHAAAELRRFMAEHRAERRREDALELVAEGLAMAEKSLSINADMPAAVATVGALHLVGARAARSTSARIEAARRAKTSLEEALRANPFLKRGHEALLAEATRLVAGAEERADERGGR